MSNCPSKAADPNCFCHRQHHNTSNQPSSQGPFLQLPPPPCGSQQNPAASAAASAAPTQLMLSLHLLLNAFMWPTHPHSHQYVQRLSQTVQHSHMPMHSCTAARHTTPITRLQALHQQLSRWHPMHQALQEGKANHPNRPQLLREKSRTSKFSDGNRVRHPTQGHTRA
jgi:hypothetical protein